MKDEKPFNWSKDFVEHLRTVHFALAAVSLALIIAISAQDRRLPKALRQIEQIARFEKEWPTTRVRLYEYLSQGQEQSWDFSIQVNLPKQLYSHWFFFAAISVPEDELAKTTSLTVAGQPWPSELTTLAAFRDFWDAAGHGIDVAIPLKPHKNSPCYIIPNRDSWDYTRGISCKVVVQMAADSLAATGSQYLKVAHTMPTPDVLSADLTFPQKDSTIVLKLPKETLLTLSTSVDLERKRIHVDNSALHSILFKEWKHGTFAQAFPELNAEASDFTTVNLADTEARILAQATTASNSVSLLGLTIPLIQITRWGPLVLLATQLYFWLHLHELVRKIEPDADGWDVAWIGIYRTLPAFIVALFSACVLPAVAAICLGVTFVTSHYYGRGAAIAGCSLIIVMGMLLSVLTAVRLFGLRAMVESESRETASPNAEELENY